MVLKVCVVIQAKLGALVTLVFKALPVHLVRKENLVKMVLLVLMVLRVHKVWLVSVVL